MAHKKNVKAKRIDDKHRLVVDTYLADPTRNQAKAYVSVYPNCDAKSSWTSATRIFKLAEVQKYLEQRESELASAAQLTQIEVLEGLRRIKDIGLKSIKARTREIKDADGEVVLDPQEYERLVDGSNAAKALELLGKTEKMFTDRVEQETTHRFVFSVNK